jgi:predicted small integral membrane protein
LLAHSTGAVRIGLRHNPVWRDRLFYGVLVSAFAHGTYLMYVFVFSETPWFAPPVLISCVV